MKAWKAKYGESGEKPMKMARYQWRLSGINENNLELGRIFWRGEEKMASIMSAQWKYESEEKYQWKRIMYQPVNTVMKRQ